MLSYIGDNINTWKGFGNKCVHHINLMASKEKRRVITSFDETENTTARSSGKKFLKMNLILNNNNMEQDILTSVWNILRGIKYSTIPG